MLKQQTSIWKPIVMNCTFKMVPTSKMKSFAMRPGRRSRGEKIQMDEIKRASESTW